MQITSQLAGKGYKDSDYTVVIAIMQWHKRIIIVQKLTLVVKLWALLSPRCLPSSSSARSKCHGQCSSQKSPTKILSISLYAYRVYTDYIIVDHLITTTSFVTVVLPLSFCP